MGKTGTAKQKKDASATPLLRGDWLAPAFQTVLNQVFARFDVDGDGLLSMEELQAFAAACNGGARLSDDEIEQVQDYFNTDDNGNLTPNGFGQMMHMQTQVRAEDTWRDLKALGYDESLTLLPQAGSVEGAGDQPTSAGGSATAPELAGQVVERVYNERCETSEALARDGSFGEALRAALEAVKLYDGFPRGHRCVGEALRGLGREEAAARSLAKADELLGAVAAQERQAAGVP